MRRKYSNTINRVNDLSVITIEPTDDTDAINIGMVVSESYASSDL
jgi:hypothetical protein